MKQKRSLQIFQIFTRSSRKPLGTVFRFRCGSIWTAIPCLALYRLDAALDRALGRTVWLRSGGYLVIEPTEAMTVIDVNTGKNTDKKTASETYLKTNLEAAEEIAVQLRLRNLSGIIVVDFIDMKEKAQNEELMKGCASVWRRILSKRSWWT